MVLEDLIEELEELRYDHPVACIKRCTQILEEISPEDFSPRILGVCGSAYRMRGWSRLALKVLVEAYILAEEAQDLSSMGDALQRLSFITRDRGDFKRSLELIRQARNCHHQGQDLNSVGKTLIYEGNIYFYLEDYRRAVNFLQAGLDLLVREEGRHRAAAHHSLAAASLKLGNVELAKDFLCKAELGKEQGAHLRRKMRWLRAEICSAEGLYGQAERLLKCVVHEMCEQHEGDALFASLDLIEIQLKSSPQRAGQTASELVQLLPLFSRDWPRSVRAAIDMLILLGRRGHEMCTVELERMVEVIREARNPRASKVE